MRVFVLYIMYSARIVHGEFYARAHFTDPPFRAFIKAQILLEFAPPNTQ